ncbi:O-antigen ligase family protein [Streptomyces sp. MI02-2A]|uniref:O-antigen ligase family protein n=1 Tax=unclassified Streptomyces TaxID=2593676 RepID=UPI0011C17E10|nr:MULTISPECIES: O-antigen ligase family protein [unclassified Streptomyces]MDX3258837.1 O-antigen ligase family protein [Streptomyces sp. MI02-2A]
MRPLSAAVAGRVGILAAGPVAAYLALFHGFAAVAAAALICFALVAWTRPDMALLMVLGLVPVIAAINPGGTVLKVVLGAVGVLLFRIVLSGFRLRPELVLVLLTALAVTVSCLMPAASTLPAQRSWTSWTLLLVGLGLLTASILAPPDPRRIAQVVAGSGAGAAGYLLVRGEYASDRLIGLGLNPNYLGVVLALSLVAAVGLARFSRSRSWLVPAVVCAHALLLTRSRGALATAAVGLACVLLASRPLRHKVLIALAIAAAAVVLPGTLDSVEGHLMGDRTPSELTVNTEVRKQAALLAVRVALDHPLRGIGYAVFPEYARTSSALGIFINTHNDYLRLAAESGMVTLALLVALLWFGLARRYSAERVVLQALCLAYAVGLLFANALTDLVISTPFWISLGCLLAQGRRRKADPQTLFRTTLRKAE